MTYATQDDLIARFGEHMLVGLTDRSDEPTGMIDASVVTAALLDTDAIIDSYLASRYVLPLSEVPRQIKDIALKLAIFTLHIYQVDPKIEADHKVAMQMLADIRDGKLRLPIAGVVPEQTSESGVRTTDRERPVTAENMKGLI